MIDKSASGKHIPSTELLRIWGRDPENEQCWGLCDLADEIDHLRAELAEACRVRDEWCAEFTKLRDGGIGVEETAQ